MSYRTQLDAEAALTRANDLFNVGKPNEAHAILFKALSNRPSLRLWTPGLRDAIVKFLELCVRLRKFGELRTVLSSYYRVSTNTTTSAQGSAAIAAAAFDSTVRNFLQQAAKTVTVSAATSVESDTQEEYTPEQLVNIAFGVEELKEVRQTQTNSPQTQLVFLWECYRSVIEVIRTGRQELYQEVALQAIAFCRQYRRRNEFRRLTILLRDHAHSALHSLNVQAAAAAAAVSSGSTTSSTSSSSGSSGKDANQNQNQNTMTASEFQAQTLVIRRAQLDCAVQLESWSIVNDLISDIADVIFPSSSSSSTSSVAPTNQTQIAKVLKDAKAQGGSRSEVLFHIYKYISEFLWENKNYLLHAYSLLKLYQLFDHVTEEVRIACNSPTLVDKSTLAVACVASAMCIPAGGADRKNDQIGGQLGEDAQNQGETSLTNPSAKQSKDSSKDSNNQQDVRLAALLECPRDATRSKLFALFVEEGVLSESPLVTQNLCVALEQNVSPLAMCRLVAPALDFLDSTPALSRYVVPIRDGYIFTLVKRLSSVFSSISIDRLMALIPKARWVYVQRLLLRYSSLYLIPVRIDHAAGMITFLSLPMETTPLANKLAALVSMTTNLARNCEALALGANGLAIAAESAINERRDVFRLVRGELAAEHAAVSQRIALIDDRIQEEEREIAAKVEAELEVKRKAEMERARDIERKKEEEARRALEEKKKQEAKQRKEEELKVYEEYVQKALTELPEHMKGSKVAKTVVSLAGRIRDVGKDEILRASRKLEAEQRAYLERRRREEFKALDYTVRAIREEERPLLIDREEKLAEEYDEREKERVELERKSNYENWTIARTLFNRLAPVVDVHQSYLDGKFAEARKEYALAQAQYQKQNAEYLKRLAEYEAQCQRIREEAKREEAARLEAQRRKEQEAEAERRQKEQEASNWRRTGEDSASSSQSSAAAPAARPWRPSSGMTSTGAGVGGGAGGSWRTTGASSGSSESRGSNDRGMGGAGRGLSNTFGSNNGGSSATAAAGGNWRQTGKK